MAQVISVSSKSEISKLIATLTSKLGRKCLLLFVGEVGSGKTTVVSELCKSLGMEEVASPSFAIHHRYENHQGDSLDHVDLYRLKSEEDLESTGFWDLFSKESGWIVVEWSDQLSKEVWPLYWPTYEIKFTKGEGESRRFEISKVH
jgi:tRNA threonylcarbamoyladenosine biosynthesis protein TsaE